LFIRTLRGLEGQDLGFARENVLLVWTDPIHTGRTGNALTSLVEAIQVRLSALPGVAAASMSNGGVLEGGEDRGGPSEETAVEGLPPKAGRTLRYFAVAPGYFAATGLPLLAGRDFAGSDTEASQPVAIVSEAMARFFFGNENPIGRRFGGPRGSRLEIVGVAKNARAGTARDERAVWYVPYRRDVRVLRRPWCVAVRVKGAPTALAADVRRELLAIDPALPILRINTIEHQLADVLAEDRMVAVVSSLFGAVAVGVACIGLYGLISYTPARRTTEIGVRLAMGATRGAIMRMVLSDSLRLVVAGLLLGVPLALSAGSIVASRLFGVNPHDPATIAIAAGMMLVVGAAAACMPARRASTIDPLVALR
jgi:predicted permease